jgi:hypothetical protein
LEKRGKPTVVVTTTMFAELTDRVAATYGMPDCRRVVLGHPLGGTDEATLTAWADASVERIVSLLTT